jgi:hypothetical protein
MRRLTPTQRSELSATLTTEYRRASKLTIAKLHPEFTEREIVHKFIEIHYGKELADGMREWEKTRVVPGKNDNTCSAGATPAN